MTLKVEQKSGEAATRAYYDGFARSYERGRGRGYHALIDDLEVGIATPFARGASVLEVGCGTGLILERLAALAADARGLDLSPGMLQRARERGLDVVQGSATRIPFQDDSFDLVCSFKVLAHVPEIGRALCEIARVTRPGGHMVLEFYNALSLRYLVKRICGPRPTGDALTEADVYTRWDTPWVLPRLLPPGVDLVDYRGLRVVTPAAAAHRVPIVGAALARAERAAVSSRLRFFGGFLVAIVRKRRR